MHYASGENTNASGADLIIELGPLRRGQVVSSISMAVTVTSIQAVWLNAALCQPGEVSQAALQAGMPLFRPSTRPGFEQPGPVFDVLARGVFGPLTVNPDWYVTSDGERVLVGLGLLLASTTMRSLFASIEVREGGFVRRAAAALGFASVGGGGGGVGGGGGGGVGGGGVGR